MRRSTLLYAVSMLALAASSPAAAADAWVSTGPYGGEIEDIFAPTNAPDLVFALASGGLYRSIDRGAHWARAESGIRGIIGPASNGTFVPLALDPLDAQSAYLFDVDGVLYRTVDEGAHWIATGYYLDDARPLALAVDALTPQQVYLGISNGILRSRDSGVTFEPMSDGAIPASARAISIDPTDGKRLLVGGAYYASGPNSGFYYSLDRGASWQPGFSPCVDAMVCGPVSDLNAVAGGPAFAVSSGYVFATFDGINWGPNAMFAGPVTSLSTNGASALLVGGTFGLEFSANLLATTSPVNDGLTIDGITPLLVQSVHLFGNHPAPGPWFAGTYIGGIFRSDDDGANWDPVNDGLAAVSIRSIAIDPDAPSHAFAGSSITVSWEGGRALYTTSGGGSEWLPVAAPPPARSIRSIVYDPSVSGAETTVYAAGLYAGQPFVATPNSGLYKSTNGGVSWVTLDGGMPVAGDPPHGHAGAIHSLALDPRSCAQPPAIGPCTIGPLQVLYGTSSGLYQGDGMYWRVLKSVDAGATWTSSDTGLPQDLFGDYTQSINVYPIVVDPANTQVLYVGTQLYTEGPSAANPGIESGVYRSDDGGGHWTFRSDGLPRYPGSSNTSLDVLDLAIHPTQSATLWVALWNQFDGVSAVIAKTTDGGAHWADSSEGLGLAVVVALRVDPAHPDTIYAGGTPLPGSRTSIFRSDDGGAHWSPMHNSPPVRVTALALDPSDRTHLLAGTSAGVWASMDEILADGFDPRALP
jgi:photosystem II stability/assembly factor-like uncharacterized protein